MGIYNNDSDRRRLGEGGCGCTPTPNLPNRARSLLFESAMSSDPLTPTATGLTLPFAQNGVFRLPKHMTAETPPYEPTPGPSPNNGLGIGMNAVLAEVARLDRKHPYQHGVPGSRWSASPSEFPRGAPFEQTVTVPSLTILRPTTQLIGVAPGKGSPRKSFTEADAVPSNERCDEWWQSYSDTMETSPIEIRIGYKEIDYQTEEELNAALSKNMVSWHWRWTRGIDGGEPDHLTRQREATQAAHANRLPFGIQIPWRAALEARLLSSMSALAESELDYTPCLDQCDKGEHCALSLTVDSVSIDEIKVASGLRHKFDRKERNGQKYVAIATYFEITIHFVIEYTLGCTCEVYKE